MGRSGRSAVHVTDGVTLTVYVRNLVLRTFESTVLLTLLYLEIKCIKITIIIIFVTNIKIF